MSKSEDTVSNNEAFGYIRSSTLDQGFGINLQEEEINKFCIYKNIKLIKIYSDIGISGESTGPQLNQMLEDLKPGMFVVIYDLQRLSRDTKKACFYFETIKKKGGKLICKNPDIDFSTSQGEFVYELLISIGKFQGKIFGDKFNTV